MGFDIDRLIDQYDRGVISRRQLATGMIALAAGYHPMTIRFVQGSGGAVLSGTIAYQDEAPKPLAGSFLAH